MAQSWPAEVSSPDFLPGCEKLLLERNVLFEGGGAIVMPDGKEDNNSGKTWLVLGVGTASLKLENGKTQPVETAWKVANDKALAEIAEALWGATMSAKDSVETKTTADKDGVRTLERIQSMAETERGGLLAGSLEVGRWRISDGQEVAVLRVIASPGHPILKTAGRIPVAADTLDAKWRDVVLSSPSLRYGGVAAVEHQGKTWLLVAGVTSVKKDATAVPPEKIEVAQARAMVEWARFTTGVHVQDKTRAELSVERIQRDNEPAWETIQKTFTSRTKTQLESDVRGLVPTGMWLADAGDTWRLVAVFRIAFENGKPVEESGTLRRPDIPKNLPASGERK